VFAISAIGSFQTKVYKIGSCYSACKTIKEKLVHCENSVSLISLRSRYVLYWDGGLIIPPVRIRQPPQSYRQWCFGCRFSGYRWRLAYLAYEMVWLEHIATVINHRLMGSPLFWIFGLLARALRGICILWACTLGV